MSKPVMFHDEPEGVDGYLDANIVTRHPLFLSHVMKSITNRSSKS